MGAFARKVSGLLAVCGGTEESVPCTVKLVVPAAVAVPEIAPVAESRARPAGNAPCVTENVRGVMPPVISSDPG